MPTPCTLYTCINIIMSYAEHHKLNGHMLNSSPINEYCLKLNETALEMHPRQNQLNFYCGPRSHLQLDVLPFGFAGQLRSAKNHTKNDYALFSFRLKTGFFRFLACHSFNKPDTDSKLFTSKSISVDQLETCLPNINKKAH